MLKVPRLSIVQGYYMSRGRATSTTTSTCLTDPNNEDGGHNQLVSPCSAYDSKTLLLQDRHRDMHTVGECRSDVSQTYVPA